ncbi:MAG: MBL fold metallo-hydrolase [Candidatus Brocadiia bacterium]
MDQVKLTVVYDNYPKNDDLETAHGFACVVKAGDEAILFDTGGSGQILLSNMRALRIDIEEVNAVVLSHMHWDHIGGLDAVLEANPRVRVHAPAAFSSTFLRDMEGRAEAVVRTEGPQQVVNSVWTTRVLERPFAEQALYVEVAEGIVVLTGCAHPGVVALTRAAHEASGQPVHAALGGFHMSSMSRSEIKRVIAELQELGVEHVGPCHCSGDPARRAMREAYGEGYLNITVGSELTFAPAASNTGKER